MPRKKASAPKPAATVAAYDHQAEHNRPTLPTGEYSGIDPSDLSGVPPAPTVSFPLSAPGGPAPDLSAEFAARDPDLDPQYVWRGKNRSDINRLEVRAPIIYQQEKIYPRLLIQDLQRRTARRRVEEYRHDGIAAGDGWQATFDAIDHDILEEEDRQAGFYTHQQGWKNRLVLGDSLNVMASLAENEQLRGKVQMIYFDPPYGIKFNSNWQPTTKSTNVKDGAASDITREPEMVKAFRDTWHDGIHSYLGYLRDRLVVARDLLADSGSIFMQIGDANVHKVRAIMEEVFGEENFVTTITVKKTSSADQYLLDAVTDSILWFAKDKNLIKYRQLYVTRELTFGNLGPFSRVQLPDLSRRGITQEDRAKYASPHDIGAVFRIGETSSSGSGGNKVLPFFFHGKKYLPSGNRHWSTHIQGMERLDKANRLVASDNTVSYVRFHSDFPIVRDTNIWEDTGMGGFTDPKIYVVQTVSKIIQRCILMTTDPGDLVLDPTCGSGTTACVAEQWGRRWITIDTSRVALALARQRLMTAKFPYYVLLDTPEGLEAEAKLSGKASIRPTYGKLSQGFVYQRVPHITLKSIANNAEIDIIWEKYAAESARLRSLMVAPGAATPEEWQIPSSAPEDWTDERQNAHAAFLDLKRKRQAEIDAAIVRQADTEYLYDRPVEDKKRVRVAGPFTVESLAPVRALIAREDSDPLDPAKIGPREIDYGNGPDYIRNMIDVLRRSGVKQTHKADRIIFTSLLPWAGGHHIAAEGWTDPGDDPNAKSLRTAVAFGPEFGSVTRNELNRCAKEAREAGFDLLLVCAFNFEAWVEEGSGNAVGMRTLLARMNADLHMTTDLKETGNGNPFVIFGEPDISITRTPAGDLAVEILGVDVYDPRTGEVRSDDAGAIDCWMLDTDYNELAFFARQVYFPGKKDAYKAFKTFLRDDIGEEEWASVSRTVSRPFPPPASGYLAVKVINHFGDEVMKIFKAPPAI